SDEPPVLGLQDVEYTQLAVAIRQRLGNDCNDLTRKSGADRVRNAGRPADRRRRAEMGSHSRLEQLRLFRRSEHQLGLGLRLEAMGHDLAPDLLDERGRSPLRASLQAV